MGGRSEHRRFARGGGRGMSASRVLSAAAALREFDLDQVAAFCDEPPDVIRTVLADASGSIAPVEDTSDRWRVIDHRELRRRSRAQAAGEQPPKDERRYQPKNDVTETRLRYAEQVLVEWDGTRPFEERRLRLDAATNALRQAAANLSPESPAWWQLDISSGDLAPDNPRLDAATLMRLQVTQEVAYLTSQELVGHALNTPDLGAAAQRLQVRADGVDLQSMFDLIARFVDLFLYQAAPTPAGTAPGRLLTALATRRVRALAKKSQLDGLAALNPLLENIGRDGKPAPRLYQELADLPAGRKHVVVYTDLLEVLPRHFRYRAENSRLSGALTEAVTDPETTVQLRMHASRLEQDLVRSPYGSDRALIGSAIQLLHQIAEQGASDDGSLMTRSDARCSELYRLATLTLA